MFIFKKLLLCSAFVIVFATTNVFADTLQVSNNRYLVESDILGFSKPTLRIARNEIFARHGYIFKSSNLHKHFSKYRWYFPRTKNVKLSLIEKSNVKFLKRYENSPHLLKRLLETPIVTMNSNNVGNNDRSSIVIIENSNNEELLKLNGEYIKLEKQVKALKMLISSQQLLTDTTGTKVSNVHSLALTLANRHLNANRTALGRIQHDARKRYNTSIKPVQTTKELTPRELSLSFPKVPWYKPKFTQAFGEFWVEPIVNDTGELIFTFKFIDPRTENERITSKFSLNTNDTEIILAGLRKSYAWSKIASEKGIKDIFRKKITCTPNADCKSRIAGNTSTQVDFLVFEGGAFGVRLIRNKGAYQTNYGMSLDSAVQLSSYIDFMIKTGKNDLGAGSRTDDELNKLFK